MFPRKASDQVAEPPREVVRCGIRLPVDPLIMSDKIMRALKTGSYEQKEAQELTRIIQPGERVLEVGAGIGFISALVARNKLVEAITVVEANPRLIPIMKETYRLNDITNVGIKSGVLACNPQTATVPFYIRTDFWSSSLSDRLRYEERIEIPVIDFNAELARLRPTLIICDIEGGEVDLFRSADLRGVKKIYMEIHQRLVGRKGIKRLFDSMSRQGFCYDPNHSHGPVVMFSEVNR